MRIPWETKRKWSETCDTDVNFAKLCVASEGFENHVNRFVGLRIGRNARETPAKRSNVVPLDELLSVLVPN